MRVISIFLMLCVSTFSHAGGLSIGRTRLIIPSESRNIPFTMENTGEMVYLLQSWLEDETNLKTNKLLVTPPLIKLGAHQKNNLNITNIDTSSLPRDRESLFWVNVKAIPAVKKSSRNSNKVVIAIKTKIKAFYRPEELEMVRGEAEKHLVFSRDKDKNIVIFNPTPYYITIINFENDKNKKSKPFMVSPNEHKTLEIEVKGESLAFWTINDYGGRDKIIIEVS